MSEHGYLTPDDLRRALPVKVSLQRLADLLPRPWEHGRDQPCDERCTCPVHGSPLLYWPARNDHACQDVNCQYGDGMRGTVPVRPSDEETTA